MKIETLWELLQEERYACLTVAEFVEIIKDSKVMEDFEPLKPIISSSMNKAIAEFTKKEGCRE